MVLVQVLVHVQVLGLRPQRILGPGPGFETPEDPAPGPSRGFQTPEDPCSWFMGDGANCFDCCLYFFILIYSDENLKRVVGLDSR